MKKFSSLRAIDWCIIYYILGLIFVVNCFNVDFTINPDLRFLYNRALQMSNCISDGHFPYFYYNDFGGVGYGSAFFYGHLTLYPFLPFVKLGIDKFLMVYSSVAIILNYWGSSFFCKRFTKNYKFVALLYLSSCFSLQIFYSSGTYANNLGIALSFFFLGYCIDFFRDNKSFLKASVFFFLVINTHTISALMSFLGCCIIMLMYFKKDNFKNYTKFALYTCAVCSYFVINLLYHSDILTSTKSINEQMLEYAKAGYQDIICNYMSNIPILGTLDTVALSLIGVDLKVDGFKLFNLCTLICIVVYFYSRRKSISKREVISLIIVAFLIVISNRYIWLFINKFYLVPFQFPTRFLPYCILVLFLICFRYMKKRKIKIMLFIFACFDLFLISVMSSNLDSIDEYTDLFCQVENGEYLDESFTWNTNEFYYLSSHVVGNDKIEYNYNIENNKVVIKYNGNSSNITVPKLYYKGYRAETNDGVEIPLSKGYSQFIELDVSELNNCEIQVYYKHPTFLVVLNFICLYTIVGFICTELDRKEKK